MATMIACIFAPRLYRMYLRSSLDGSSQIYSTNLAEQCGDFAISYLFPAGMVYSVWHRKLQYILYLSLFLASSYAIRATGRYFNPTFLTFLQVFRRARTEPNTENMEALRRYDFEFKGWPVGFTSTKLSRLARQDLVASERGNAVKKYTPCWLLGWVVAHTFGIRLIYPGLLVGPMLRTYLEDARGKLVLLQKGVRTKIVSSDGYYLDAMFFDRRREANTTIGKTLVICCEGNAGFYEIGMAGTPIAEGYSVLGWNHPGFGGSSGTPYPLYELNAAEAVFEYATKELGFREEDIVLYGWSIGGFPATYLAAQHPNVKGLVLDATFDDLLPLALPRMPAFLSTVVRATIRYHVDLRVSKEMRSYAGPVRLIRRTEDEIIADPPSSLPANRGNYLLMDILRQRYPFLLDNEESERALRGWLNQPHVKDVSTRAALERSEVSIPEKTENLSSLEKATLILQIAEKILTDFKSTHCTPLPGDLFILPWSGESRPRGSSSSTK
ncbi:phosphatidylserine lipase ABHD16A isoform X2 [Folsomia candida]|uniref:Abhydrolase domain-containing protein 16A n=1 Tax=Folsomia candida TaxID=158441 RepID=A0A226CTM5_FOLCA|nr:phosphatidylserine lipase ABHD16A isoform X2 [Folsomia candida]OXA36792.1 Abhydrolase domain-containing protein 16A [Folsomia candida]